MNLTSDDSQCFLRPAPPNGLDSVAFHYSIYRSFQRFPGLDGNLQVRYDIPINFVDAWNTLSVKNDSINAFTGDRPETYVRNVQLRYPPVGWVGQQDS